MVDAGMIFNKGKKVIMLRETKTGNMALRE